MSVNDIAETAHETTRGSLNAILKRARLPTERRITMDDAKKRRLEEEDQPQVLWEVRLEPETILG